MQVSDVTDYAKLFVKTPYLYGGKNPIVGLDCSGYVSEVLKAHGMLEWNARLDAQELYERFGGREAGHPLSDVIEGDLLFFGNSVIQVDHVAYAMDWKLMLESDGGDFTTLSIATAGRQNAFVKKRPILSRRGFLGAISPKYDL